MIISNDISNQNLGLITVIPITSQIDTIYPFEVRLFKSETKLQKDSKACVHQIRTMDIHRVKQLVSELSKDSLNKIDQGIKRHLDLS